MSSTEQTDLVNINDNYTEQELLLIIMIVGALLSILLFICGVIIYSRFSNKTENKQLYRLERAHRTRVSREMSNMLVSIHNLREKLDETFTLNK